MSTKDMGVVWYAIDTGPAMVGQDDGQWFMNCPTCGELRSSASRDGAASIGLHHNKAAHAAWDLTDGQLRAECARRKMEMDPWPEAATSEELRAECARRGFVVAQSNENGDWRGAWEVQVGRNKKIADERDEARDELERVAERASIASAAVIEREKERDEWKCRTQAAETKPEPRGVWPLPKVGEIVASILSRLEADDTEGACDVIDEQVFQERLADVNELRGGRKLAADIRGVIVAMANEAKLRTGDIPTRKLRAELRARDAALAMGEQVKPFDYRAAIEALADQMLADQRAIESGPGITHRDFRPDNSVDHLDEDLVAADATREELERLRGAPN